jgi:hypothetical protein
MVLTAPCPDTALTPLTSCISVSGSHTRDLAPSAAGLAALAGTLARALTLPLTLALALSFALTLAFALAFPIALALTIASGLALARGTAEPGPGTFESTLRFGEGLLATCSIQARLLV